MKLRAFPVLTVSRLAWPCMLAILLASVGGRPCAAASRAQCRVACMDDIATCRTQATSRRARGRCKRTLIRGCRTSGLSVCETSTTTSTTATSTTMPTPPGCGTFLTTWGTAGSGDGQFNYPSSVATDGNGHVFVADMGNNRIQKFDATNGSFLTMWGLPGSGPGQFNGPVGVATGGGFVYVVDTGNNRIQEFDAISGTFVTTWGIAGYGNGQFVGPSSAAFGLNSPTGYYALFVADTGNHRIEEFEASGTFVSTWSSPGSGQFSSPQGVAIDGNGHVFVADTGNNRIQKFDAANGASLTTWGVPGSDPGQFDYPSGVATDGNGNVYVVDADNNRIQKFDPNGTFLTTWGSYGSGNGRFSLPWGVASDGSGSIYVADTGNNRIQKFACP